MKNPDVPLELSSVKFGLLDGLIEVADDFDAPLPEDILAAFEGRD